MITVLVVILCFLIVMVIGAFVIGLVSVIPAWLLLIGFFLLDYVVFKFLSKRKK